MLLFKGKFLFFLRNKRLIFCLLMGTVVTQVSGFQPFSHLTWMHAVELFRRFASKIQIHLSLVL